MRTMRIQLKPLIPALLVGVGLCGLWAQESPRPNPTSSTVRPGANRNLARKIDRTLSADDRLSVIAAALDSRMRVYSERDCSHLVHGIYERAGFDYNYASSSDLYEGAEGFQRVAVPEPGDLVVWRGHAGIIIRPSHHIFFSFLHGGPGIDDYENSYWTRRGRPRFYRYVKDDGHTKSARLR
jgi:cell wall-associated NlpC family hydrolase